MEALGQKDQAKAGSRMPLWHLHFLILQKVGSCNPSKWLPEHSSSYVALNPCLTKPPPLAPQGAHKKVVRKKNRMENISHEGQIIQSDEIDFAQKCECLHIIL
eukprot:1134139-Pelagomonas_calceolata.AAC.4